MYFTVGRGDAVDSLSIRDVLQVPSRCPTTGGICMQRSVKPDNTKAQCWGNAALQHSQ